MRYSVPIGSKLFWKTFCKILIIKYLEYLKLFKTKLEIKPDTTNEIKQPNKFVLLKKELRFKLTKKKYKIKITKETLRTFKNEAYAMFLYSFIIVLFSFIVEICALGIS